MKEIWIDLAANNDYECSNLGRIRSKSRTLIRSNGRPHKINGKILTPNSSKSHDYYQRTMLKIDGKYKTISFHREILKSFKPHPLQDKLQCNHINGIKTDNRIENLEWVTGAENLKHSFETGLQDNFIKRSKERNRLARKIDLYQLKWAKLERELFLTSYQEIAKKLNVHKKTLMQAIKGETYKDVQENI